MKWEYYFENHYTYEGRYHITLEKQQSQNIFSNEKLIHGMQKKF